MVDNNKTSSFRSSLAGPNDELYFMVFHDDHTRVVEMHKAECPVFRNLQTEYGEKRKTYMKEKKQSLDPPYRYSAGTLNDLIRHIDDTIKKENYPGWRKADCCFKAKSV